MSLLWTDGFDLYGATDAAIGDSLSARGYSVGNLLMDDDTGRLSGNSLKITTAYEPITSPALDTTNDTLICGIAFKTDDISPMANDDGAIIAFNNGSDIIGLEVTPNSNLTINVGGSTLDTSSNTFLADTWYFIEWKFTVGANEAYTVKVNGDVWISGNGDTQDGSATYYNQFKLRNVGGYSTPDFWFDDLYIMDATGNVNNDFIGDAKIITIQPDGDDSCNFATLSTGNDHYALVDDAPFDGDSTYVEDSTSGNRDLFTYDNTSDANTIRGLSIITAAKKTDTNSIDIRTVVDSNGTVETGANYTLGAVYNSGLEILEEDPDTSSAWTQSGVNSAKFGFEIV